MKLFTIIKGKSSRIKNKNFKKIIDDKSLWKWTVNKLRAEGNEIYINTDSESILEDIKNEKDIFGIKRSQKHISWEIDSKQSGSPVESMYKEFCENFVNNKNEVVCLFHVTSPFVSFETIKKASTFLDSGYDSVQSVKRIQDFLFMNKNDEIIPLNYDPLVVQRTQDLEPVYMSLGAFFISRANDVISSGRRIPGKCYNFEVNSLESIEIDYYDQLELARIVAQGLN